MEDVFLFEGKGHLSLSLYFLFFFLFVTIGYKKLMLWTRGRGREEFFHLLKNKRTREEYKEYRMRATVNELMLGIVSEGKAGWKFSSFFEITFWF